MKSIKLFILAFLLLSFAGVNAQTYCFSSPEGYAAGTTGGGSGSVTIVTTKTQLSSALTASGSGVVIVQGAVQCDYLSVLVTNKTLLGLPGAKLYTNDQSAGGSGILYIKPGSNNVIIRNLIFEGPGAYDSDGRDCLTNEGTNVWVDHCEFRDGMDGNFDNKGKADKVTISWCKFTYLKSPKPGGSGGTDDHRFSNLVGSNSSQYPSDGQYSITWQNCWWASGCVERMARARNSELHMLNCYWNSSVAKKCIGLEDGSNGNGTQLYLEGAVFETPSSCKNIDVGYGGSPDVTVTDCIGNNLSNNSSTVSKPSYSYTTLSSSQVKSAVTSSCGAGATLNVATSGVVSSSCDNPGGSISLSASAGEGSVSLSWSSSNIASNYQVYRDTDNNPSGRTRIAATSSNSYTDNSASSGTTYYYWIKATDTSGSTVNSNAANATPTGSSVILSATAGNGSVSLSWSSSDISSNYQVYRDTDSNPSGRTRIAVTSSKSYTDNTASNGTTYYYWIKATDTSGATVNSNAASATPSSLKSAQLVPTLTETMDIAEFKIYPNPATSLLTILLNEALSEGALMQIFDNTGRLVLSKEVEEEKVSLDISRFKAGLYIVKISNSYESIVKRFIKQ